MEFIFFAFFVVFVGVILGKVQERLTSLSIVLVGLVLGVIASIQECSAIEDTERQYNATIKNLEEVIQAKEDIIDTYLSGTDEFSIVAYPFYRGDDVCYQFRIQNFSMRSMYEIKIKYHPPIEAVPLLRQGIETVESRSLLHEADIGTLHASGNSNFGEPFSVKRGEEVYFLFHINTRHGMYWYTYIATNNGPIEGTPFLTEAYKVFKAVPMEKDDLSNDWVQLNMQEQTNLPHPDSLLWVFKPIDSAMVKPFPIDVHDEKYLWDYSIDTAIKESLEYKRFLQGK